LRVIKLSCACHFVGNWGIPDDGLELGKLGKPSTGINASG
jgi:hypothetical protein